MSDYITWPHDEKHLSYLEILSVKLASAECRLSETYCVYYTVDNIMNFLKKVRDNARNPDNMSLRLVLQSKTASRRWSRNSVIPNQTASLALISSQYFKIHDACHTIICFNN